MALYVNTNVSSLNANRQLSNSTRSLDTSYQRLASGLRINSAKDDAAGLQISDRMTSQINGLNQGNRNAQDGISFAQTAEGAMDEMTSMYQRIRTLALQSANGTNSAEDRKALQQEVSQLCAEIDRISQDTTFAGEKILNGNKGQVNFQVGADANQMISVDVDKTIRGNAYSSDGVDAGDLFDIDQDFVNELNGGTDLDSEANAKKLFASATKTNKSGDNNYVKVGTDGSDDVYALKSDVDSYAKANGYVTINADGDAKDGSYVLKDKASIVEQDVTFTGWSVDSIATMFGINKDTAGFTTNSTSKKADAISFDISTADGAQAVVASIDKFISAVDSKRAELGAVQNRLESTMRNQSNISQNLSDARSQIRDTDFARETANMTQTSIIQQASQSILSQANQRPQLALSLLG